MSEEVIAYKLTQALGELGGEGEIIHLSREKGEALCKAGLAEPAAEDEVHGDAKQEEEDGADEAEMGASPVVANSIDRFKEKAEKVLIDLAVKAAPKAVPAEPIQTPAAPPSKTLVYKSMGEMISDAVRLLYAKGLSGQQKKGIRDRLTYAQEGIADAWSEKLGAQVKAPLGIGETVTGGGDVLVNPEFSSEVYVQPLNQIDLQGMCTVQDAKSNLLNQRYVNMSALSNGSIFGGLNMVNVSEGSSFTSSLPAWANFSLQLQKQAFFLYYTVEILEDASYNIQGMIDEYLAKAFLFGINTLIVQGGNGLEGLLSSPSLITVTKSSNDTSYSSNPATVITYADIANMWARVESSSQASPGMVGLFHPALSAALHQMTYTFSGSSPVWGLQYNAERGLDNDGKGALAPYKIFGVPLYPCHACSAPGAAGDFIFVDMKSVKLYRKPYRVEISREYQFGSDQVALRAVHRLQAKSLWRNTLQGVNGSQTFSNIVTMSAAGT